MERISLNRHWKVSANRNGEGPSFLLDIPFLFRHGGHFSMSRTFEFPKGERKFLIHEGIEGSAEVYLNGVAQGKIEGRLTRGELELKGPFLDGENEILLEVSQDPGSKSPGVRTYLYIETSGPVHISDLYARGDDSGTIDIHYKADGPYERKDITFSLFRRGRKIVDFDNPHTTLSDILLYRPKSPELYDLVMTINSGEETESKSVRLGFYSSLVRGNTLLIAGRKKRFSGVEYGSLFPGLGAAVPFSPHYEDVLIMRRRLGADFMVLRQYQPSHDLLKSADEIGLLSLFDLGSLRRVDSFLDLYGRHASLMGAIIPKGMEKGEVDAIRKNAKGALIVSRDLDNGGDCLLLEYSRVRAPEGAKMLSEAKRSEIPFIIEDDRENRCKNGLDTIDFLSFAHKEDALGDISGKAFAKNGLAGEDRFLSLSGFAYASNRLASPMLRVDDSFMEGKGGAIVAYSNDDYLEVYKDGYLLDVFKGDREHYGELVHPPVLIKDFIRAGYALKGLRKRELRKIEKLLNLMALSYPEPLGKWQKLPYSSLLRRHGISEEALMSIFFEAADPKRESTYQFISSRSGVPTISKAFGKSDERQLYVDLYKDSLTDMRTYDSARIYVRLVDGFGTMVKEDCPVSIDLQGPVYIRGEKPTSLHHGHLSFYIASVKVDEPSTAVITISASGVSKEEIIRVF